MISIGIIGAGIVGERIIKQLQQESHVEIKMVYDEQTERLTEISQMYNIPMASSIEEVFHSDINWVYIATPPAYHAEIANLAASAGINILCEKPLAHNVADGEMMVESVQNNRVQTAMHFPLMYAPAVRELAKRVKSGAIGKVVRIELQTFFPDWPRRWQRNPWIGSRSQGGFVREVFPHYLQLMNRLFNELNFTSHHITYPQQADKCETGIIAHGLTKEQIPFLLTGLSDIGQKELLQFKIYGKQGVLTLENWTNLYQSTAGEDRQLISEFEEVPSLFEEMNEYSTVLVDFEEGLLVQRYIDHLLIE
ncbi:Gfo/Idh/MocA family protein [Planococcus versutus]|uniref:Dehydrogenase n=1 Tax=Planococcus versutus TaxID=1302659 RepID=A0A1B1S3N2_9BACL|nr:Gfo/Idh/MocA family oxidoreductase [Planococcus versutus]ANU27793.1 dehydrogenase [Planococcus versutus]